MSWRHSCHRHNRRHCCHRHCQLISLQTHVRQQPETRPSSSPWRRRRRSSRSGGLKSISNSNGTLLPLVLQLLPSPLQPLLLLLLLLLLLRYDVKTTSLWRNYGISWWWFAHSFHITETWIIAIHLFWYKNFFELSLAAFSANDSN